MLDQMKSGFDEVKSRLLFVLFGLVIFRVGAHIPLPGVDLVALNKLFAQYQQGLFGLMNMFSGGSLSRLSLFAMGLMPYITTSIVMQLLTYTLPYLSQLKKEGSSGRHKINQFTRYGTVFLALFQSMAYTRVAVGQGIVPHPTVMFYLTAMITLTTGTMFLVWLGEQITERGIGNGISLLIFAGIVSGLPSAFGGMMQQVREGQIHMISFLIISALIAGVVYFIVFMERSQRQIPINYPKQHGRAMAAPKATVLPLKLNMAGVIPAIFASSIIVFPGTISSALGHLPGLTWLNTFAYIFSMGTPLYVISMSAAIIFFSFFYTSMTFNATEMADNLKKSSALIPGIRPGSSTATYLNAIMTRLTLLGSLYLVAVSLLPEILRVIWNVPFYFGGTSLLIVIVVVIEFIAQLQAHLVPAQYASLKKKQGKDFSILRS